MLCAREIRSKTSGFFVVVVCFVFWVRNCRYYFDFPRKIGVFCDISIYCVGFFVKYSTERCGLRNRDLWFNGLCIE